METLEIQKQRAIEAHENAKSSGRKLLEDLFGKKTFQKNVMERIKTFDDVLEELGIPPYYFKDGCKSLSADEIAYRKLKLIAQVLNEGWEPNWGNFDEWKYYPWFKFEKGSDQSSGFGFSYFVWSFSYSYSGVGSRLCFKSSELAEYAGKQFESIYKEYLT